MENNIVTRMTFDVPDLLATCGDVIDSDEQSFCAVSCYSDGLDSHVLCMWISISRHVNEETPETSCTDLKVCGRSKG
eukprot:1712043-Rhodomonas_salina.3